MSSMEDFERGSGNYSDGGMIKASLMEELGDLQEDQVCSVMKTTQGSKSNSNSKPRKKVSVPPASAWGSAVAISSRGGSQAKEYSAVDFVTQHSSAPVDIPDWSNILKMKSKQNYLQLWDDDDDACDSDDGGSKTHHVKNDDDDMVPPHEYLARKLENTQMASFSMCEGVGRTLKGRDLSKTRNAVLTKTGFLE
ncbi:protein S40-4-like [Henckelia pumila]|uniref:protein S40-4-like n=1 Tax=Henckelia pumila TaxID=405737 RepID=UPI003C6E63FC